MGNALQTLFNNQPLAPRTRTTHHPPLMVKVAQNDENSSTFRPECVRRRHPDIIERDIGGLSDGGIRGLNEFGGDAFDAGDENNGEAVLYELYAQ